MPDKNKRKFRIIGRRDRIDLPEIDLMDIETKIDTGASTSALHVRGIQTFEKEGEKWVLFRMRHPSHPSFNNLRYEFKVQDYKRVRNSSGKVDWRYTIRTRVILFEKAYKVEFTLTDRSKMECPVLLGRKLLYRKFIVDVSQKDLSYSQKLKNLESE